jgi:hypothetical protein
MDDQTDERTRRSLEIIDGQLERMATITRKLMGLKKYSNRDYVGNSKITDIDQPPEDDDAR